MTASRPEADSEYSRGHGARRGRSEDPELRWQRRFETHRSAVLALGLLGAALLLVETGGGAALILSAAAGMLLEPLPSAEPRGDSRAGASPTRSAS